MYGLIINGAWFQITDIYLRQLYYTLRPDIQSTAYESEKSSKLEKELKKLLGIKSMTYELDAINNTEHLAINSEIKNKKYKIRFYEEGTFLIINETSTFKNLKSQINQGSNLITSVAAKKLKTVFESEINKLAKISELNNTASIVVLDKEPQNIKKLFNKNDSPLLDVVKVKNIKIFKSDKLIIIIDKNVKKHKDDYIAFSQLLIFFSTYRSVLTELLIKSNNYWKSLNILRKKVRTDTKDILNIRDNLIAIEEKLLAYRSRLEQMSGYLVSQDETYKIIMNHAYLKPMIESMQIKNEFKDLKTGQENLKFNWNMLIDYGKSAKELISMVYEQSTQSSFSLLQAIFIVGVAASIISLGTIAGSTMLQKTIDGELISITDVITFDINTFGQFGVIALVLGLVIFFIMRIVLDTVREVNSEKRLEKLKS